MNEELDEFLTIEELAALLKVHPRTIRRLVDRGEIPVFRVGRQLRFRRDWVREWIERGRVEQEEHGSA